VLTKCGKNPVEKPSAAVMIGSYLYQLALSKNGKLHARQRYECKACGYNFTLSKLGKSKPPEVRRMALQLYLEGLSLRGIERLLKISPVIVLKWVRQWGKAIERLRREAEPKEVRQVEIREEDFMNA
jgi:transposase-like protein